MKILSSLLCAAALCFYLLGCGEETAPDLPSTPTEAPASASILPGEPLAETTSPAAAALTATPAPVNSTVDAYIREVSACLLESPDITEPDDFSALMKKVDTPTLKGVTAWMKNKDLDQYIASGGEGGVYLWENKDGRSIGIYVGGYEGTARSGRLCAWVTLQPDDDKLYFGPWEGDYPNGDFRAYSLTTNSGNLISFSGKCIEGVWDGPVSVSYVDPDIEPLKGAIDCDMGRVAVAVRPDGQPWNSDIEKRFCFLALHDGAGTYIPLYRDWTDRDFVVRMAYNSSLIEGNEGK